MWYAAHVGKDHVVEKKLEKLRHRLDMCNCVIGIGMVPDVNERISTQDEEWAGWVTTDLNVSYLNAATKDVRAVATSIRAGKTVVYVQVDVFDSDERFIASGRVTYLILRPR